jgi:hypothetical protein
MTVSAYIPETYRLYSHASIAGGINACFLIGTDIWTVAELENAWPNQANLEPANKSTAKGAILSSLIFNDRVPWFLFGDCDPLS